MFIWSNGLYILLIGCNEIRLFYEKIQFGIIIYNKNINDDDMFILYIVPKHLKLTNNVDTIINQDTTQQGLANV